MTKFNQTKYLKKLKFKKYSKYSVSKDTEVVRTTVGDFISGDVVIGAYIDGVEYGV